MTDSSAVITPSTSHGRVMFAISLAFLMLVLRCFVLFCEGVMWDGVGWCGGEGLGRVRTSRPHLDVVLALLCCCLFGGARLRDAVEVLVGLGGLV